MNKKCLAIIALLIIIIADGIYTFVLQGNLPEVADGRIVIHLNTDERELVLTEMRTFLTSVQQITKGVAENDMESVAQSARKSGKAAQQGIPGTLAEKLPVQFKQSGFDTHAQFDQLAMDAEDIGDSIHALSQLSTLMQNCISCHALFRIDAINQ
jgi:cytochrome c556